MALGPLEERLLKSGAGTAFKGTVKGGRSRAFAGTFLEAKGSRAAGRAELRRNMSALTMPIADMSRNTAAASRTADAMTKQVARNARSSGGRMGRITGGIQERWSGLTKKQKYMVGGGAAAGVILANNQRRSSGRNGLGGRSSGGMM